MNDKEIFDEVTTIIEEKLSNAKGITLQSNLVDDFKADSLDVVEIVMALENKFGIHIDSDNSKSVRTVEDIVKIVSSLLNKNPSNA